MNKVVKVDDFLRDNPSPTLESIFGYFKSDLESVIIACIKANLDFKDFLIDYNAPHLEEEIQIKIDQYVNSPYLSFFLRKNVKTILLLYENGCIDLAKEFVNFSSQEPQYISEISDLEVFPNGTFLVKIPSVLMGHNSILNLDTALTDNKAQCVSDAEQEFYVLLELYKFLTSSEEIKENFKKISNDINPQDLVSLDLFLFAKLNSRLNKIELSQSYESLKQFVDQDLGKISGKTIVKTIQTQLKNLVIDESKEGLSKIPFHVSIVSDMAELKAKGLLFGLELLVNIYKEFPSTVAIGHYRSFQDSGKETIKEWFSDRVNEMFSFFKDKYSLELVEINPASIDAQYNLFIGQYYQKWEILKKEYAGQSHSDPDTNVFLSVTSFYTNEIVKINERYF